MSATDHHCLVCSAAVEPFLDLGVVPLANALLDEVPRHPADEPRFPLRVGFCAGCAAVQLLELVPPEKMFTSYYYFSSFSDAFVAHALAYAEEMIARFQLGSRSFVVEVASNDGYLLCNFVSRGIPCLGVEPAANIAATAQRAGIPTLQRFFDGDASAAIRAEHGPCDLILGNNVLAHVPAIVPFLSAAEKLLKPRGVAVWEFPWLAELVERLEFDTIYHEHVYYLSLHAVGNAAERAGLEVFDVSRQPVHGGSLRVLLARPGTFEVSDQVGRLRGMEQEAGLTRREPYREMGRRVARVREDLNAMLADLKAAGHRLAGYGASAKGSTLLNYCGIGTETLEYLVDRSTVKQGKLAPGVHLPILPAEKLAEDRPDETLLLVWNFADEIRRQQQAYEAAGGRFIVPVPEPRILSS